MSETDPIPEDVMDGLRAMLNEPSAAKIERDRRAGEAVLWQYSRIMDMHVTTVLSKRIAASIRGHNG